jgi:hypothetical protein
VVLEGLDDAVGCFAPRARILVLRAVEKSLDLAVLSLRSAVAFMLFVLPGVLRTRRVLLVKLAGMPLVRFLDRIDCLSSPPSWPGRLGADSARVGSGVGSLSSSTSMRWLDAPLIAATTSFSFSCTASDSLFCDRWIRKPSGT